MKPNTATQMTRRDAAEATQNLLDTDSAAQVLGISRRTLQELAASREIVFVKIGRCTRFHPEDLAEFVERNRVKQSGWKKSKLAAR